MVNRNLIRKLDVDNEELERAVKYVKDNPARAGLKNWKWVWCAEAPIEKS